MSTRNITLRALNAERVSTVEVKRFHKFCISNLKDEPASNNMVDLVDLIYKHNRFKTGEFFFIYDGDHPIGCSGIYRADFSSQIALAGVRSWLAPSFRSQSLIRDYVLPAQRSWALTNGLGQIAISFNEYNKNLRELWKRKLVARSSRTSEMLFYKNMTILDYPVTIKYTPQWVMYETLIDDFYFDWNSIRAG